MMQQVTHIPTLNETTRVIVRDLGKASENKIMVKTEGMVLYFIQIHAGHRAPHNQTALVCAVHGVGQHRDY